MAAINHTRHSCGWSWRDRHRKRWRDVDGKKGKIFRSLITSSTFQSQLKNNFGRGDCLSHAFAVSCVEWVSVVFNLATHPAFNSQNKHSCYMLDYSKTLPGQTKGYCENPFFWSNGAVKISFIANTHSTGLCWPRGWQPNYTKQWPWKEEATGSAGDW